MYPEAQANWIIAGKNFCRVEKATAVALVGRVKLSSDSRQRRRPYVRARRSHRRADESVGTGVWKTTLWIAHRWIPGRCRSHFPSAHPLLFAI